MWFKGLVTKRRYRIPPVNRIYKYHGESVFVTNNYGRINCGNCGTKIYVKLTVIATSLVFQSHEYHLNYGDSISGLKKIPIYYLQDVPVYEVRRYGRYYLATNEFGKLKIIGRQVHDPKGE